MSNFEKGDLVEWVIPKYTSLGWVVGEKGIVVSTDDYYSMDVCFFDSTQGNASDYTFSSGGKERSPNNFLAEYFKKVKE